MGFPPTYRFTTYINLFIIYLPKNVLNNIFKIKILIKYSTIYLVIKMTNQIFSFYAGKKNHLNHNNEFELIGWVFFMPIILGILKLENQI